jgi:hypothetical protein
VTDVSGMFAYASAFNQNLCSWGLIAPAFVTVVSCEGCSTMFTNSGCQTQDSPNSTNLAAGPWCQACLATSSPTMQPNSSSTLTPSPTMAPTAQPTPSPTQSPYPTLTSSPTIEYTDLVLDGPPLEIPFLSKGHVIIFLLASVASVTAITCESLADTGGIDLILFAHGQFSPGYTTETGVGFRGIVTLTTVQETADVYLFVHAFAETSNAEISCCTGQVLVFDFPNVSVYFAYFSS